ncbi:MAG: hypothetical protein JJE30_06645 [Desulfuromonadales bacterium]|nr:hypothetical protein [Desulfuromonadales bacterium]
MKFFPAAGVKARRIIILILGMFLMLSVYAAAATYEQFKHPQGDFSITYPSAWQRSVGLQTVRFFNPTDRKVEISIGGYPLDRKDPPTAEAYIESSLNKAALYGYRILQNKKITLSNTSATRLEYSSKLGVDQHGQKTAERSFNDVEIVISHGSHYHVLRLSGLTADAVGIMPEFDRMVEVFSLGNPASSLPNSRLQ